MVQSSPNFLKSVWWIFDEMYLIQQDLFRDIGVSFSPVIGLEIRKIAASLLVRTQFEDFCNRMVKQEKLSPEVVES